MNNEQIMEIAKACGEENICRFCIYEGDCPKGMRCYGGEPQYPPCADKDIVTYFDWESYLESIEGDSDE